MDDLAWFDVAGASVTPPQREFLSALRQSLGDSLHPYCCELSEDYLMLVLDVDAPDLALASVGIALRGRTLRGDRISVHDRTFPEVPTSDGFSAEGDPSELAVCGGELFARVASRPVVLHEWLHRGRVYARCYLFEDSGERLADSYRSAWAPTDQEAGLLAAGFSRGRGWIQTVGLGEPHRITLVRGTRQLSTDSESRVESPWAGARLVRRLLRRSPR